MQPQPSSGPVLEFEVDLDLTAAASPVRTEAAEALTTQSLPPERPLEVDANQRNDLDSQDDRSTGRDV